MFGTRFTLRTLFVIVAAAAILVVAVQTFIAELAYSQKDMTHTAIGETRNRIFLYAKSNGKLPDKLTDLPKRSGYINMIIDDWGRDLIYEIDDRGLVTLASLGRDGKKGGWRMDADIVHQYRSLDNNGKLSIELLLPVEDEISFGAQ